jgi:hypothetical protein
MKKNIVTETTATRLRQTDKQVSEFHIPADLVEKLEQLTPVQARAFESLSAGGTVASAAVAAGVTRRTIHNWMQPAHEFRQSFDRWKESMSENARTRLLILGHQAMTTIATAIKQGDVHAALTVVKGMGLLAAPPVGDTTATTNARLRRLKAEEADRLESRIKRQMDFEEAAAIEPEGDVQDETDDEAGEDASDPGTQGEQVHDPDRR